MSIIFVPDPHGSICQIIQIGMELRPCAIITVGDNEFKRKPYTTLFKALFDVGIHVYTVDGNHDGGGGAYLRCNEKYRLDGKVIEIDGKRVAGSRRYAKISSDGAADILVSHHPARAWSSSVNSAYDAEITIAEAKRRKVGIVFHGHIHPRYDQKDTGLYIEQGVRCVSLGDHVYDMTKPTPVGFFMPAY